MNKQISYLQSINTALRECLKNDERIVVIGEDLRDPYGGAFKVTKGLSTQFPDRVLNTPISEASITGLATGLALRGFRPILEIMFGDFLTLCADQIINHASKFHWMYNQQVEVPLLIRTPMGGGRGYGPTHSQCMEKLFFGVPGLKIIAPSIYHNPGELLKNSLGAKEPTLFIEHKLSYPKILKLKNGDYAKGLSVKRSSDRFETVFISNCNFKNPDVTIISYGYMVEIAEELLLEMSDFEVNIDIVAPSLIKPVLTQEILNSLQSSGRLIIVEEGTLTNGWGAEISSLVAEKGFNYLKSPIKRVAALDLPIANTKTLEDEILPDKENIKQAILEVIE